VVVYRFHRLVSFPRLNSSALIAVVEIILVTTLNRRTGSGSDLAVSSHSTGVSDLLDREPC
jgi:ABC-type uncharacterized transport system permease subunit